MSREITKDLKLLKEFIGNYEIKSLLDNRDFLVVLSQQHRKYFSYLTMIAEIADLQDKNSFLVPSISKKQIEFLLESCSDIGNSIFVMSHGSYKAAKMMQRSSIETFLKGFTLDSINDIDQEKSIFKLFDRIRTDVFFNNSPQSILLDQIHQKYKLLCMDVHTASPLNMNQISALKYFPAFSKINADKVSEMLQILVSNYSVLIGLKYKDYFSKMHHRNKENVLENIPKKYRQLLQGLD